jgi:predicted adenine nucleotide alpha hydrolase (AANH) superfamily ATPase
MTANWRVFLRKGAEGFRATALSSPFRERAENSPPEIQAGIESQRILRIDGETTALVAAHLNLLLPEKDHIHIFTSPEPLEPADLRGKKLLTIHPSSLSKEYLRLQIIDELYDPAQETYDSQRTAAFVRFHSQSERTTLRLFRRARCLPAGWPFIEKNFSDLPDFSRLAAASLEKPRMLLHVCCGPDAGGVIQQLKKDYALTCFWYDPNIQPQEEYEKRLEAFIKVARIEEIPVRIGEYDVARFFESIRGLEHTPEKGAKCSQCYDLRLDRSAEEAAAGHFDYYATTLAISPHKVQEKLVAFGDLNERRYGVPYYHRNFMRADGFKDSVDYSHEHDIYRQDYCGCIYSLKDGGPDARSKRVPTPL